MAEISVHGPKESFVVMRAREAFSLEQDGTDWKAVSVDGHDRMSLRTGAISWYELLSYPCIPFLERAGDIGLQIDSYVMETGAEVLITEECIISVGWIEDFNLVAV